MPYKYALPTVRTGTMHTFPGCCSANIYSGFGLSGIDEKGAGKGYPRLDAPHVIKDPYSVKRARNAVQELLKSTRGAGPFSALEASVTQAVLIPYRYMAMYLYTRMNQQCTSWGASPRLIAGADNISGERKEQGNSGVFRWLKRNKKRLGIEVYETAPYYGAHATDCAGYMAVFPKGTDVARKKLIQGDWEALKFMCERFLKETEVYITKEALAKEKKDRKVASKAVVGSALDAWRI